MKLRNRFKDEHKLRVWGDHQYCALTGINQNCSLHHIEGCKEDCHRSIYNSIMLCYEEHKKADGHNTNSPQSLEFRKMCRQIAYNQVRRSGHVDTNYDKEFLEKYPV